MNISQNKAFNYMAEMLDDKFGLDAKLSLDVERSLRRGFVLTEYKLYIGTLYIGAYPTLADALKGFDNFYINEL